MHLSYYFLFHAIQTNACSCGKTTIIESLKYAVTGSLPPGNKSGQAFVHDPKSMNQASVKANIKLRFTNRAGNPMVVVRSMEVTQKKTSLTFKALDGIIRTTDPETGQRVSLSHKCTELDRQIPQLMGVSKPILEHVVFCHQEDSSWPLMEGAVLKKRFDDIFDSTRYAKALDAIRKLKNEYASAVKDLKADQAGLAAHKKAAEGFREELDAAKSQLEEIDDTIANTDERIAAEEEEKEKFQKVIDEIADIHTRRDEIDQQIDIARATAESLREACDDDWTQKHNQEELEGMLATFDDRIEDDERELQKTKREYKTVQKDIEALGEEKMRINAELAKCTAQREQHEKDLRQRQDHMEKMGNEYDLQLEGGTMTQGSYGGSLTGGTFGTQQSAYSQGTVGTTTGGGRRSLDSVATGLTGLTQDTLVTISSDDMTSFLNAVSKKNAELRTEKEEFQHTQGRAGTGRPRQEGLGASGSAEYHPGKFVTRPFLCRCAALHYNVADPVRISSLLQFFRTKSPGSSQRSMRLFKRASLSSHLARPTKRSVRAISMRPRKWPPNLARRLMLPTAMHA